MRSDSHNYKLLPVAIMAHNEARVIARALESTLAQEIPEDYFVQVIVAANGCTDDTEGIVKGYEARFPGRVKLLSIREKGKTNAINETIRYLDALAERELPVPYVVFLDADSQFAQKDILVKFIARFAREPKLCAIGADCIPDVCFNSRKDLVAEMYRTVYKIKQKVKVNSISGMCYAITLEVLTQIDFPAIQFSEDQYVTARINGWFLIDPDIRILFATPSNLRSEIKRRTRQEVSSHRFRQYYRFLKAQGSSVRLFTGNLGEDYRWGGGEGDRIIEAWCALDGAKAKVLVLLSYVIRAYSKIKSFKTLRAIRKNHALDYWEVAR